MATVIATTAGLGVSAACAADDPVVLTKAGIPLGTLGTAGKVGDLRITVDLQGDVPTATYVWGLVGSSQRRVRNSDGFWLPFNGDPDNLIDNHFEAVDGQIEFKVMDEDIGDDNHGVTISIGYRAGGVLKYGNYTIYPDVGAP